MKELELFKKCLMDEAQAMINTIDGFGEEIVDAVKLIQSSKGYVIISGVGKSGHIGEKIAATMASTGTPSFFMHAVEAVHGDLGMVREDDVVILISNSGETKEVLNCLAGLKIRNIKTVALTRNHKSTLAKACDVSLAYKYDKECDDLHLAPTVSSTLTLAVGDALAVTLSKLKGFTPNDFHLYHPGGSLGKMLENKENK